MASSLSPNKLFSVEGLVVVITGGGSGLGQYAAKVLDANGAKAVYVVGRREEALKKTASLGVNGSIIPIVGDVTSKDSLSAIAAQVRKEQGYINVLFANAGIVGPSMQELLPNVERGQKPTLEQFQEAMFKPSMDEFSRAYHINATAVFFTAVAFLDLLDAGNKKGNVQQSSQILVTSSIAGFSRAIFAGFAYSASKAAANHLVKTMATYFIDYNIRVNSVNPGLYPSEMTDSLLARSEEHKTFKGAAVLPKSVCPAERTGSEQDFAAAILFLCSPAGAYLDGNALVTDGGRLAQQPSTY